MQILSLITLIAISSLCIGAPTQINDELSAKTYLISQFSSPEQKSICPPLFGGSAQNLGIGSCDSCRRFVSIFSEIFKSTLSKDLIAKLATWVCDFCHIEDNFVCKYVTTEFKDEVLYVVQQLIVNPDQVCPILYEECGDVVHGNPYYNWTDKVTLPDVPKPPLAVLDPPPAGSETLRILHISDLHYDFLYTPGTEANCADPLCCRPGDTTKQPGKILQPAGYWGSVANCDVPYWTVDAILEYIANNEQFDMVYWTGDLPSHNIWQQSRAQQVGQYANMTALFKRHFGNKPVFSAVGNHESAPVDSYPPHWSTLPKAYNLDWLYTAFNSSWRSWLADPQTSDQIMKRASFSQKVNDHLRVISINTNYNDDNNFWVYLNQTDPDGVMAWLIGELQDAENKGEKVHVIAHEPPSGGGKFWSWKWIYYNIVNRYESTIRGQFMGHEHSDSFRVFFHDADPNQRVTGAVFNTPSVTTYNNHFPGYRIYTIDGRPNGTWAVLDYETKLVNLTTANADPSALLSPQLEYTFNAAYDTANLFPVELTKLIQKMDTPEGEKYLKRFAKYHQWSMSDSCDAKCVASSLCNIKRARPKDPNLCAPQDGGYIPFGGHASAALNAVGLSGIANTNQEK